MANILLLHGPNLNLLGLREPEHYGRTDLASINQNLANLAKSAGHRLHTHQSNAEHELIDLIQQAPTTAIEFILFNPAAFTHTSIALRDALSAVKLPFIEIHLSNVHAREDFRQHSYFSAIAVGVISGFGAYSYDLAMQAALAILARTHKKTAAE